jgi:hypothetical protein
LPRTSGWTQHALEDAGWEVCDTVVHLFGTGWPKSADKALKPAAEHWILARNGSGGSLQIDACRVERGGESTLRTQVHSGIGYRVSAHLVRLNGGHDLGSFPTNFVTTHCPECQPRGTRMVKGSAPASGPTATGRSAPGTRSAFGGVEFTPSYGETQTIPAFACLASCECGAASLAMSGGEPAPCDVCGAARSWCCPVAEIDRQSGTLRSGEMPAKRSGMGLGSTSKGTSGARAVIDNGGGASRFFPTFYYAAKSPTAERNAGCHDLYWVVDKTTMFGYRQVERAEYAATPEDARRRGNVHPTVKSIGTSEKRGIARWLVRLITPPGGRVADITCGSGSIPIAAGLEGFESVGMDICPEAIVISQHRAEYFARKEAS